MAAAPLSSRLKQIFDLYLPAALMAGLALGAWWLVRSNPPVAPPSATAPSQRQMDYSMEDFSTSVYAANGQATQSLRGQTLQHFNTREIDISQVELTQSSDANPQAAAKYTQARAARAVGRDDGSDITLTGQVQLLQTQADAPSLQVNSQRLRIYAQGERLQAEDGVRVARGKLQLQGQRMDWDQNSSVLQMQGKVRTTVSP